MSQITRVGIVGGGWPGLAHARGYREAGGFSVVAVADLIPERRAKLAEGSKAAAQFATADELIADAQCDAISVCLPTHLHFATARACLKAGKHVLLEIPPALSAAQARKLEAGAEKAEKTLMYGFQRRFGGAELAAKQVIEKNYLGAPYHARATWMRTRGIPIGTGWYTDRLQSGGGALMDLGAHMLDIGWSLLGQPKPISAYAVTHRQLSDLVPADLRHDVEDAAMGIVRFEGGKSLELAASWAINQAPGQNGTACRVYGAAGAVEVYTPAGPMLYRHFDVRGNAKETALKQPKVTGHAAMMRQFRECILGKAAPSMGAPQGVLLMEMIDGLYKSAELGRSVALGTD